MFLNVVFAYTIKLQSYICKSVPKTTTLSPIHLLLLLLLSPQIYSDATKCRATNWPTKKRIYEIFAESMRFDSVHFSQIQVPRLSVQSVDRANRVLKQTNCVSSTLLWATLTLYCNLVLSSSLIRAVLKHLKLQPSIDILIGCEPQKLKSYVLLKRRATLKWTKWWFIIDLLMLPLGFYIQYTGVYSFWV